MNIPKETRIALTGATGFLGAHIIRGLVEQGFHNIVALKRKESRLDLLEGCSEKIEWIDGDLLDLTSLEELLSGVEICIHAAAKVSYNPKFKKQVFRVNVTGTHNLVNVSLSCKVRKLIYISSVAAIGRVKSGIVIDEKTNWTKSKYNTHYSNSKHLAELEAWRGMVEGMNVVVLNPSMIIGPSYWGTSSTKLFMHVAQSRKMFPTGENGFVDVRDVAQITIKAMEEKILNERYVVVSENCSYLSLFEIIAKVLHTAPPNIPIKKWIAQIAWRIIAIKSFFTKEDPAITKETVRITSGKFHYNSNKSKKAFDHKYITLEKSISDLASVYESSKKQKRNFGYYQSIF